MRPSRKIAVIVLVLAVGMFGYSQYVLASQIGAQITQSSLIKEDDNGSTYDIELRFDNPSLLVLTAGETDFFVIAHEKTIGKGKMEPFILPSAKSVTTNGILVTDSTDSNYAAVKITGTTKYDIGFASIDVPFVYYPTEEQARKFIHKG